MGMPEARVIVPVTLCCHLAHVPDKGHTGTPSRAYWIIRLNCFSLLTGPPFIHPYSLLPPELNPF